MIHDADIEDKKFQRVECIGLNAVFEAWAKMGWTDDHILQGEDSALKLSKIVYGNEPGIKNRGRGFGGNKTSEL